MIAQKMRAWTVDRPYRHPTPEADRASRPRLSLRSVVGPCAVCGVCRTDLHLAEGDLTPKHRQGVPGHEVVGLVDELGTDSVRFSQVDRIGIPWLASACGTCRLCVDGRENLCLAPRFTGWDVDGG
jgi:propanol-preferring alcohol dehydrogenase